MTAENLASVILGLVGVGLQLVFKFVPKVSDWYQAQGSNKGMLMLAFVVVAGGVYFGLSCSPWGAQLGISLSCDGAGVFTLLKALFILASSQSLTYLYTR